MLVTTMTTTAFASTGQNNTCTSVGSNTANNFNITDSGVYINGTYYTKNEFIQLLDTAEEVPTYQIQSAAAIVAGTWWIPGLGEVVITAAGTIIIAGTVIEVGSWIYNTVVNYFTEKAYKEAKKDGKKTDNHSTQKGGSLDKTGEPNSSKDLKDSNGELKQRRYYDKNGNADMDIDYKHGGNGKEPFPHRHDWNNGVRGKAYW